MGSAFFTWATTGVIQKYKMVRNHLKKSGRVSLSKPDFRVEIAFDKLRPTLKPILEMASNKKQKKNFLVCARVDGFVVFIIMIC